MKRLLASTLALSLAAATGLASAQTYNRYGQSYPDRYGQTSGFTYDYARVLRVDPVIDRYGSGYTRTRSGVRCYEEPTYVRGGYEGGYRNEGYRDQYGNYRRYESGYRNDGYYDQYGNYRRYEGYRNDGYYDQYGGYRSGGTQAGANVATVIGGIVGAAIGSQVGGGSARYATAAIGTMVGGMAGRQVYEQSQRQRDRVGTVRVCDPEPYSDNDYYSTGDRSVTAYDVTYEYAGRTYNTRTNYHPGDRIRVRVEVHPE